MIPLCREEGIGIIPWSPLARGLLAGNRRKAPTQVPAGETPRAKTDTFAHELYTHDGDFEIAERCAQVAAKRGIPSSQVALAWLLQKPGVTAPIVGATKLEQLDQAIGAVTVTLQSDEVHFLEERYQAHPVLGHE